MIAMVQKSLYIVNETAIETTLYDVS